MPRIIDDGDGQHQETEAARKTKLVNRGPAGLLHKKSTPTGQETSALVVISTQINKITEDLRSKAVPIDSLVPDPENARLHPERNMESIRVSLKLYGQVKPLVVRRSTRVVIAGNGTLAAAKELGWTEIAVTFVDMDEYQAAGYGLADNRTSELAKWDFEVVARLDRLLQLNDPNYVAAGWSNDELEVLRGADWSPPQVEGEGFGQESPDGPTDPLLISFTPDQYVLVGQAIDKIREMMGDQTLDQASCLQAVCHEWLHTKSLRNTSSQGDGINAEDTGRRIDGGADDTQPFPHWRDYGNGEEQF